MAIDQTQTINRAPLVKGGRWCSLMPEASYFHIKRNRCVLGAEALHLQGFPVNHMDLCGISQHTLHDLAGNRYAGTVVMAVLIGIIAHAPGVRFPGSADVDLTISEVDDLLQGIV